MIQLNTINVSQLTFKQVHTTNNDNYKVKIYSDEFYFYKIWGKYTPLTYFIQNGLDYIWMGKDKLPSVKMGMINDELCPALVDFIYDGYICVGYKTHKGIHPAVDLPFNEYLAFVDKLVDTSEKTGYGYVDIHQYNMIILNGKLSLIDLNFMPIKLNHGKQLNNIEKDAWIESFANKDMFYIDKLKKRGLI